MKFKISKQSKETLARAGTLEIAHAKIETPFFMPVGTNGSVKGISMEEIQELGYNLILGNTYHLYLKPGDELIDKMGKLRKYINWPGAILTDSGGYQVFSLGQNYESYGKTAESSLSQVVKRGVWFRSHLDGSKHLFTPEKVIDIQRNLGSDIMMVLDECTEFPATHERAEKSMKGTHRWAKEASEYWGKLKAESDGQSPLSRNFSAPKYKLKAEQALFGIVQGSTFEDLREESAKYISSLNFDGIAVGGVSVGEGKDHMYQVMRWVGPLLPKDKPHYLMGIGEPEDIIEAVKWGFDMFDCVLPTRLGRHGTVWTTVDWQKFPKIDLRKSKYSSDQTPIMENCGCPACRSVSEDPERQSKGSAGYTKAYLSHLIRSKEMLGMRLASLHNLWIMAELMRKIRANKLGHF